MNLQALRDLPRAELIERAKAKAEWNLRKSKNDCAESLVEFIRQAWPIVEPAQPYTHGWHIEAIALHLEAITRGEITRLLINVPPGTMKSLMTNVFWPAWEWGPCNMPSTRYLCTAHSQNLAIRDSTKMRRLVQSDWYQKRWGSAVKLVGDQNQKSKFENAQTGFREAAAFQSLTGVRADRVLIDDPHSVDSALSDVQRESTITTFLEAIPTRLSNPDSSAIVVIMQRLAAEDVSGVILEKNLGYTHLCLPMEYDPNRHCVTELGFEDPREEDGELLFPQRFPRDVVERDKRVMGPWAVAGQFQQSPSPRGGGIVKREWWQLYDDETARANGAPDASRYPAMDYIIASLDPAYTEKKENDPSALTIWGVFQRGGTYARRILTQKGDVSEVLDDRDTLPAVMLMHAWTKRLPLHGPDILREPGEAEPVFRMRERAAWGLIEHIIDSCNRYKVDLLLVEAKGPGLSVAQEIKRLNRTLSWGVHLVNPIGDKVARAYAVQPVFSSGAVYAPDKTWAEAVITEWEQFPRGKHDDLCLVAGTMISMADGTQKAIEDVVVGDFVITPNGSARVSASGLTGARQTWRMVCDVGVIEGTAGHPIFANGEWKNLSSLSVGDVLATYCPFEGGSSCRSLVRKGLKLSLFILTAANTIATQTQKFRRIVGISPVRATGFTEMYGNIITGKFLKDIRYITLMGIHPTTTLATLNVFPGWSTGECITKIMSLPERVRDKSAIWLKSEAKPPNGIQVPKDWRGIRRMLSTLFTGRGRRDRLAKAITPECVNGAGVRLVRRALGKLFALPDASRKRQDLSRVKANTFTNSTQLVYNLTVEIEHCYYANNVLVHNCDSTTQALSYLRARNLLQRSEEVAAEVTRSAAYVSTDKVVYDV